MFDEENLIQLAIFLSFCLSVHNTYVQFLHYFLRPNEMKKMQNFHKRMFPFCWKPQQVFNKLLSNRNNPTGSKCYTGTQAELSNKLLIQALNSTQRHKWSFPTSSQFSAVKPHKDTSLAINKLYIYRSQMMGMIPPGYINTRFQDYSLAVISTELLYKLTLFKYLML